MAVFLAGAYHFSSGKFGYSPPVVREWKGWTQIVLLGACFAGNIGLNNFSLSLISITVNNMIRSTSPVVTAIAVSLVMGSKSSSVEWLFMILGTVFVLICVVVDKPVSDLGSAFVLGVSMGFLSTVGGALMFVIVELFGKSAARLNAIDSMCYMSLPASVFLMPLVFTTAHVVPGDWAGGDFARKEHTDIDLLSSINDTRIWFFIFLSGLFAFLYNILQFFAVQHLNSVQTAFASNMSKVITVLISWAFLEKHTSTMQSAALLLSALGGLICFACYSLATLYHKDGGGSTGSEEEEETSASEGGAS
eukprot:gnl/TRDRNA2_/TRDRNA2_135576_c0_seq2.p1 gnl/TRDRNA2_/TRDRNA2_135576_c0~~gnl/TRDRNA2_/TRDRNA2_135576_c0_seq2.p1  ORF type:complete len:326 (-),score=36.17 gnl/TRDRNA2_/TRDRNA2_135576_c0_seq2:91-1008(-)